MIQIETKLVGLPLKEATQLRVTSGTMQTTATTCKLYFELFDVNDNCLFDGNLDLTEQQFADWGADNVYLEEVVIEALGLVRA